MVKFPSTVVLVIADWWGGNGGIEFGRDPGNAKDDSNMKIAQVAPLFESVPPKGYGGTERVVAYLTDALIELGHEVTLFASGDSLTKAKLIPCCEKALRADSSCIDSIALHIVQLQEVFERVQDFDIVHFHTDYLHFPFTHYKIFPHITTLHGKLSIAELQPLYNKFSSQPVISISYSQRFPLPQAQWAGNIYHGLPLDIYSEGDGQGGYAAFIGRISPEKRVDRAIAIAMAAGKKLKIAAKVDQNDKVYFEREIKHLLDNPLVEFLGEIGEDEKEQLLRNAECLLFPIDWPEPFGMVMIEAMACGTPVIAFENGSVPEIIDDGVTGYIVNSILEGIEKLKAVSYLSRKHIRRVFELRFSASRMAEDYLAAYEEQIAGFKRNLNGSAHLYKNYVVG